MKKLFEGLISLIDLPFIRFSHVDIISSGLLFNIFDENPTAIPDDPFIRTVGIIGKKYLGSILVPSSSLYSSNSKSLYRSLKFLFNFVPI